jgi:hypothetical protein
MIVPPRLHFGSESVLTPGRETARRLMKVARTPVVEIKSASMILSLRRHSPDARLHERQCLG